MSVGRARCAGQPDVAGGEQGLGEERTSQAQLPKAKGTHGGNVKQEPRTLMPPCLSDKHQAEGGCCHCPVAARELLLRSLTRGLGGFCWLSACATHAQGHI